MCVAAVAWDAHPRWQLLAIGNRDEFHDRPAAPLAEWDDGSGIVAGRDLRAGGTWLGLARTGRFALVTNLRGHAAAPACRSRGGLVSALLAGDEDAGSGSLDAFNPFSVIIVDRGAMRFLSNRPAPVRVPLPRGVYGLSNGGLDEPWPKTLALKAAMTGWLTGAAADPRALFAVLESETLPAYGLRPKAPSDIALEPRDTPPFIRHPVYGTRCATIVAIARDGTGTIAERRFAAAGEPEGETTVAFDWPPRGA